MYEYVQIFVISNGTRTKYYSNTTRISAIKERENGKKQVQKTSNSFEFTSFWSDGNNNPIFDIVDFTKTFLAKHTILNILTKYCVLTSEDILLVMRPYQITATERIINRIEIATNYKKEGTVAAGGYIWHTTGSGKTLTSFKTAQLVSQMPDIDKVIFVVDRKDLDYQTMKEYDRFEQGAANGNKNTKILQRQLENKDKNGNPHEYKIIITTIQKLDNFIKQNPAHAIYNKHVVMIFDECHRSQFGDMHQKITKTFKNYHIFGFTGTPIFAANSSGGNTPNIRTTEQAFGDKLHTYTIVDAINDGNVLPFKIDYINTIKKKEDEADSKVEAINTDSALLAPERISEIVSYILEHFNQKTKRTSGFYTFNRLTNISDVVGKKKSSEKRHKQRINGFNSILAVSSIEAAKLYYDEFKRQMSEDPSKELKIATIYSYGSNEEDPDGFIDDEDSDDTSALDMSSREFLEAAIQDYNKMFNTAYDTSADKFSNYYKDLSLRMKNREVDLLIVVNMFLTGFDATTLNTLWVDKNLKQHGLIQAFSRTNRILNKVKTFGNIVCFRNLQKETDEAISLFGDRNASGIVLMRSYNDYYYGYDENIDGEMKHHKGYQERVEELLEKYPIGVDIIGEKANKDFIKLFGHILRLNNILSTFDDFIGNEILSEFDFQDYKSVYNDLYLAIRTIAQTENIDSDVVFEMELIKQVDINIDYILMLAAKYHESNCMNKTILVDIDRAVKSSIELRSKKDLIDEFLLRVNSISNVHDDWQTFINEQKENELMNLIKKERLNEEKTKKYFDDVFRNNELKLSGPEISDLMPPVSRFGGRNREEQKRNIVEKFKKFFEKYRN